MGIQDTTGFTCLHSCLGTCCCQEVECLSAPLLGLFPQQESLDFLPWQSNALRVQTQNLMCLLRPRPGSDIVSLLLLTVGQSKSSLESVRGGIHSKS